MEPTTIVQAAGPWYAKLASEIGPLAATLLLFLAAAGYITWKIALAVIDMVRAERQEHTANMTVQRTEHRADIERIVVRLDERDQFQRDELVGLVRAYERSAAAQVTTLEQMDAALQETLNRPCMIDEQRGVILKTAREEAAGILRRAAGVQT